jgi:hypothetical protein
LTISAIDADFRCYEFMENYFTLYKSRDCFATLRDVLSTVQIAFVKPSEGISTVEIAFVKPSEGISTVEIAFVKVTEGISIVEIAFVKTPEGISTSANVFATLWDAFVKIELVVLRIKT